MSMEPQKETKAKQPSMPDLKVVKGLLAVMVGVVLIIMALSCSIFNPSSKHLARARERSIDFFLEIKEGAYEFS